MSVQAYTALDDVLAFWHPTLDEAAEPDLLDWGPVARASSADLRLRVRNLSQDYTAVAVTVTLAEPELAAPTVPPAGGQHLLSADGTLFAATCALGDLDPQQTSSVFVLRRVTAPDATAGYATFLLTAGPLAWAPTMLLAAGSADADLDADLGELPTDEED